MTTSLDAMTEHRAPTMRQTTLAAFASLFGWGLDLFDLFILLYVAPVVGRLFFPADKPMLSLAAAYASFAVTLLVRPLGSALFGSYADRHGRRKAMMIAVTGVGLSTAVFGLLPTVGQIGWMASVIFLLFRLVQGVFVGGVVASSHTIGTESVSEKWRGLLSGAVGGGGSAIGGMLASAVFWVVSLLAPGEAFGAWGWRVMFFSGLLTSIIGLLLFRNLEESPAFRAMQARKIASRGTVAQEKSPLKVLVSRQYIGIFLLNIMLTLGSGAGYYLTSGYLPTVYNLVNKLPNQSASLLLFVVSISGAIGALISGMISQSIGRKPVFIIMGLVRLVVYPSVFLALPHTTNLALLGLYGILLAVVTNGSYGPLLIFLNERFPTALRASGTGLSWNIGYAIGGIMPTFVSLLSPTASSLPLMLAIFSTVVTVIFLVGAFLVPETRGNLERS